VQWFRIGLNNCWISSEEQPIQLKINRFKKLLLPLLIVGLTYWIVSESFHNFKLHELIEHVPFNRGLSIFLKERLVKVDTLRYPPCESPQGSARVIYVMGGSLRSLKNRFRTAAELYRKGIGKPIMILSQRGITEYDPRLGRNLTNNEWAIRELVHSGVKEEDIEFVSSKRGTLGTMREARVVSDLVSKRGHKCLIIVSSSYHTKRVWETFSRMLVNDHLILKIVPSNEDIRLRGLLLEYCKLMTYKYVLLPIYVKLLL